MTQLSKCETCRARKVKCDEQRPVCGGCMKKHRSCYYKTVKSQVNTIIGEQLLSIRVDQIPINVATPSSSSSPTASLTKEHEVEAKDLKSWRLKYVRETSDSKGLYVTFRPSRRLQESSRNSFSITPPVSLRNRDILCEVYKRAARWGSIFGYESIELNPLGHWLNLAWSAAGEDTAVNCACEYTISSMIAFQSKDKADLSRAYVAGTRAIQSLRSAVRACSGRKNMYNLVLAILLHCAAEHFIKLGSFNYVAHFLGAAELLKTYARMGGSEHLLQLTAKSNCADEMMEAILNGKQSSTFEGVCCSPTRAVLEGPCSIDVATEAVQYVLAQLPRLVFQAREFMDGGSEASSDGDLIERIVALFNYEGGSFVERTLGANSATVMDQNDLKALPTGFSVDFKSVRAFYVAAWYHFSQMILCGLMQRLDKMHADGKAQLNIPGAKVRDVAAASSLAKCVEYALRPTRSRPFIAMAVLGPLQLSIGTWLRVQRQQPSTDTVEYVKAVNMIDWCLNKARIIEDMWQSAPATVERVAVLSDLFAGGPYIPNRGLQ